MAKQTIPENMWDAFKEKGEWIFPMVFLEFRGFVSMRIINGQVCRLP